MKFRRNRDQGIKPGDRVTITGTIRDVARDLGRDTNTAIVDVDPGGLPDGWTCTLRVDVRVFGGAA